MTLGQSIFRKRYIIITVITIVAAAMTIRFIGLPDPAIRRSTRGLPKITTPHTMNSLAINLPVKVAIMNFQGVYFASPSGMIIKSSGGKGVNAAIKAANQPYLVISEEEILSS